MHLYTGTCAPLWMISLVACSLLLGVCRYMCNCQMRGESLGSNYTYLVSLLYVHDYISILIHTAAGIVKVPGPIGSPDGRSGHHQVS